MHGWQHCCRDISPNRIQVEGTGGELGDDDRCTTKERNTCAFNWTPWALRQSIEIEVGRPGRTPLEMLLQPG
ncbi:hypothetical protein, partial [Xanthomonas hortorum]|uniref:hypothetical protein n=1 Tax=Xanthomonas hortorum TaxID=56454 RepID=UPI001F2601FB